MSSTTGQSANGKKTGSGASSVANTPSGTPVASVTGISNGQTATQTSPPPNNNAPKYGTLVPNRIFVGGISANTTENELMQLFSNYGTVKAAKIIQDRAGVSKGYGFITFESEDDAKRLQRESDNIVLRERKLNIAPAIKKQQPPLQAYGRAFDGASPPAVAAGNPQYYFPGSIPFFQGNLYYPAPTAASGDPTAQQTSMYQAPTVYPTQSGPPQTSPYPPMIFPAQPMYMPQQYPMPMPYEYNYYQNGSAQYVVGGQQGGGGGAGTGGQPPLAAAMQRPGSPPRQPCYGQQQQLPYPPAAAAAAAAAAEAIYYNVPMYGTVEGAPVYQDTVDMSNGTPLSEEYSIVVDPNHHHIHQQQQHHNHQQHHTSNVTATTSPHQQQQQQPATSNATPTDGVVVVSDGGYHRRQSIVDQQLQQQPLPQQPLQQSLHQQQQLHHQQSAGTKSAGSGTPVVSLLSETHKVKDVTSMQSGRRRKSSAEVTGAQNSLIGGVGSNGYNGYHHQHHHQGFYLSQQPHPPNYGSFNVPPFPYEFGVGKFNGGGGHDKGFGRRKGINRNNGDKRNVETSSLPRTESNSSASELGGGDDKLGGAGGNETITAGVVSEGKTITPPPAPYSPMTHSQYGSTTTTKYNNTQPSFQYYNHHHHHNNYNNNRNYSRGGGGRGGFSGAQRRPHYHQTNDHQTTTTSVTVVSMSSSVTTSSGQQVHGGGGGGGGGSSQHFIPPVRRARRSVRRNNTAPISEIGAGDAPLPAVSDVADACKKLDGLKL